MSHPPRRPPGGLRHERRRPRSRRRLFSEARALHAGAVDQILSIDGTIEALVDERLACLDVLVDCRRQLKTRFSNRHSRRRASVDEAPFPEAPPSARPLDGVELRSVALTILRRHGSQRLRDLHALIHLYGYCINSVRPVQRLGDAMAYEERQGRVERLERGVYGPATSSAGPDRYAPPPQDLDGPLRWERPTTEPGPPHLDPDLAADPELWSGAQWPTEEDVPDDPEHDFHEVSELDLGAAPPAHADQAPPPPPPPCAPPPRAAPLGDDSPANRRPEPQEQVRPWEPPP